MFSGIVIAAVVLLIGSMLFGTANLSLRTFSRHRLAEILEPRGKKYQLEQIDAELQDMILTTSSIRQVGHILFTICIVALLSSTSSGKTDLHYLWAALISIGSLLMFSVAIPNAWARYAGENYLAAVYPLLRGCATVFRPVVATLRVVDGIVRRLAGVPPTNSANQIEDMEKEVLDAVSEGEKLGAIDTQEKEMIESVMEFSDTQVGQVMTPRTQIIAIKKDASLEQVRGLINREGHSRVPVYDGTIDSIQGVLYAKDLLKIDDRANFDLTANMRTVPFIPETMSLRELLRQFQENKVHMAIILDEYGGTAGLVTFEDLLEELVGEITDEYEPPEPEPIVRLDDDRIEIDARLRINDLNDELNLELPEDDDYDTIGGFIFSTLGRIPRTGEHFDHENLHIEIVDAEERRINRVRIRVDRQEQEQP